jgi:hypothetical protein
MDRNRVSYSMSNQVVDRGPRRRKSLNPGRPDDDDLRDWEDEPIRWLKAELWTARIPADSD